jgi:hypothetical protein
MLMDSPQRPYIFFVMGYTKFQPICLSQIMVFWHYDTKSEFFIVQICLQAKLKKNILLWKCYLNPRVWI